MNRYGLSLVIGLLLVGCGTTPAPLPPLQAQALRHHQRGAELRAQGDLVPAGNNFIEAYRVYASIEDLEGSSAALLNLAALARLQEQYENAAAYLEQAHYLAVSQHAGTLAYEQALLSLHNGNFVAARSSANMALGNDSKLAGAVNNLLARICYLQQDSVGARRFLEAALKRLNDDADARERSNALRLLGRLEIDAGRTADAAASLQQALLIDKRLNLPDKLAVDLLLLADNAHASGNWRTEIDYLRRLFVVEVNDAETTAGGEILCRLAELVEVNGMAEEAKRLRENVEHYIELGVVPLDR